MLSAIDPRSARPFPIKTGKPVALIAGLLFGLATCGTPVHGQSLADKISPLLDDHKGEVTVSILNFDDGQTYERDADKPMPTASLIKFPLMIAAYQKAERDQLDLNQQIQLTERDKVPGSGILSSHFSDGATFSVRDAIELMMAYSDNTATNLVIDVVGLKETSELMEKLGCSNTKMHSKVYRGDTTIFPERSKQFGLGSTTASETVTLLSKLHHGELVSTAASEKMLGHMLRCDSRDKIPRDLPAGAKAAHKTGAVSSVRCDAGIVYGPDDSAFAICILTRKNKDFRWSDDNEANLLCGKVTRIAYDHFFPEVTPEGDQAKLQIGSVGRLVEALQRTLNASMDPSPDLAVDGDFGPNTQATVRRFQRTSGLADSGEVDAETWKALGTILYEDEPVPGPDTINTATANKAPPDQLVGKPFVTCKAWAIGDASNGELLFGEAADEPLPMASTTKIMTALVVLRQIASDPSQLAETVTFSRRADDTIGSTSGIRAGESVPVSELIYGLLLPSGNDASVALAEHFGNKLIGDDDPRGVSQDPVVRFVDLMNVTAAEMDLKSTHFENTHGLTEPGHQSSAGDLMRLAWHAMKDRRFRECVGTTKRGCTVTGPGGYKRNVVWKNTNRLLQTEGYDGVKTGTTSAAGSCLVASRSHGDDRLLVVVLGSQSSAARYADSRNLFRWAFRNREPQKK